MGLSHALYEEMTFDESGVTSRDWRTYPILTMADVPEIKVVILNHPEVGAYGGWIGSGECTRGVGDCRGVFRRDRQARSSAAVEADVRSTDSGRAGPLKCEFVQASFFWHEWEFATDIHNVSLLTSRHAAGDVVFVAPASRTAMTRCVAVLRLGLGARCR